LSFLNNKSEFNLEGAQLLIDNNLYAPSVHCSYYSVFQKLKYKYVLNKNISYDDLTQLIILDSRSTHKFVIEEFCNFIQDRFKKRELKNKINDLKAFRVESDYEDLEINYDKSNLALTKSKEIIREINTI
jgi:uncharacterized protein (UPF0332 family)